MVPFEPSPSAPSSPRAFAQGPASSSVAAAGALSSQAPFRPPRREQQGTALAVEGTLPAWLRGDLLRTCPAVFERGPWRARHLFDGLGMIYGFSIDEGAVTYRNRMLRGRQHARIEAGAGWATSWADGPQRSWLRRVLQPLPEITDNANVNLCRIGEDYVAMTETPHQLRFDPRTLRTLGPKRYLADALGEGTSMIAHPHFDAARKTVVSVAVQMSANPALLVYEVGPDGQRREVIARHAERPLPYVHDFGLTARHALLVLHPYRIDPRRMLWSQSGVVDHFHWDGRVPTRIAVLDRRQRGGAGCTVEVPGEPFFVFHAINAFERPDGEIVFDVLTYPDDGIVQQLRIEALQRGLPDLHATAERLTIDPRAGRCRRERLSETPFEFPIIDYRRRSGRAYRYAWGADTTADDGAILGRVVKVDTHHGDTREYLRPGFTLGEPVFVPRDRADADDGSEDDGVVLTVASDLEHDRAELVVLDARTLEPRATAAVDDAIPIGFHGQFFTR